MTIQRYTFMVIVLVLLGGFGLSYFNSAASERTQNKLIDLNLATVAIAEHRGLGKQLDILLTTSDLMVASDVAYLTSSFSQQLLTIEESLDSFQKQFDSEKKFVDTNPFRMSLNKLNAIIMQRPANQVTLQDYDSQVLVVIAEFEETTTKVDNYLSEANALRAESIENQRLTLLVSSIVFLILLGTLFYAVYRNVTLPIADLSAIETADQVKSIQRKYLSTPIEVGLLADHLLSLLSELEDKVATRTLALQRRSTELEEQTHQLTKARDAAEAANLAKNNFLASMSHELRSPLNSIIGVSDILLEEDLVESQRSLVSMSKNSGVHLLRLIETVLDFSKIEQGKLDPQVEVVNLESVLDDCKTIAASSYPNKNIPIRTELDQGVPAQIKTDATLIRQVVLNLLTNALKFSEDGLIRLQCDFEGTAKHGEITITVIDEGPGIPLSSLEQIFEPFEQLDSSISREFGGVGLGLSISRKIAHELGGSLSAKSNIGVGTEMIFSIPVVVTTETNESQPMSGGHRLTEKRILIVEDEKVNAAILEAMLLQLGNTPDLAENGQEAVNKAETTHYDIILMDIQMPVMDGITATKTIRGLPEIKQPKIIYVTAFADDLHRDEASNSGADSFISKPIDREILLSILDDGPDNVIDTSISPS